MAIYTESLQKLIDNFSKLPGIGMRTAERLALFVINMEQKDVKNLATSIWEAKKNAKHCKICNNFSEKEICDICKSPNRDRKTICVVEHPKDVIAIEKSASFKGLYHVLMGAISPIDGVGPKDLAIDKLIKRLKKEDIKELIIATNSDIEGETTALYLKKVTAGLNIKTTRIASGIPMGSQIEYTDQATLAKALEGRHGFE